ncbi:MAG: hypothetical protein CYPHOPRED_002022 [Cyphobasidiales sp. Tagirdzhanova-0007]|nr:MAG: hypothetical protein CYPHOPRED_002022 [Cyphobasidiales sp. Tagirdzhanova-0007]
MKGASLSSSSAQTLFHHRPLQPRFAYILFFYLLAVLQVTSSVLAAPLPARVLDMGLKMPRDIVPDTRGVQPSAPESGSRMQWREVGKQSKGEKRKISAPRLKSNLIIVPQLEAKRGKKLRSVFEESLAELARYDE